MRCQLTGFINQAALVDFSQVFKALHFQSFVASLSKVRLPRGFQLKALVWGGIVAYQSVFQDEFQDMRGLFHLKEIWKLSSAHLPLILSHRGCLTFRPQLKHPLQECPSNGDLLMLVYFSSQTDLPVDFLFYLLSTLSVGQIKTLDSRIGNWSINEFLTDSSIQGMCHNSFAFR